MLYSGEILSDSRVAIQCIKKSSLSQKQKPKIFYIYIKKYLKNILCKMYVLENAVLGDFQCFRNTPPPQRSRARS